MPRTVVALFRSEVVPPAPSFHLLQGIHLSMHPAIVEQLQPPYRLPPSEISGVSPLAKKYENRTYGGGVKSTGILKS